MLFLEISKKSILNFFIFLRKSELPEPKIEN
jgi:hypothetical protein